MNKYKIPEIAKGKIIPNKKPFFAHPHPATEHLTIEHPPEVIEMVFKKIIEENPTQLDFEIYTVWKNNLKKIKLELEMPQCCGKCPMAYETEGCYSDECQLYYYLGLDEIKDANIGDYLHKDDGVPNWCPLLKCEKVED